MAIPPITRSLQQDDFSDTDSENEANYTYINDYESTLVFKEIKSENTISSNNSATNSNSTNRRRDNQILSSSNNSISQNNPYSNSDSTLKIINRSLENLKLEEEKVAIAHYRGIHFYQECFNKEQRKSAVMFHNLQNKGILPRTGLFSSAVHELSEIKLGFPVVNREVITLKPSKEKQGMLELEELQNEIVRRETSFSKSHSKIKRKMSELQKEKNVDPVLQRQANQSSKESYDSRFDEFIQRYVNSYKTLSEDMEKAKAKKIDKRSNERTRKKWTILKDLGFTKLPLVSTSEESKWSLDYATGFVNWDKQNHCLREKASINPLTPKYSPDGHPKHPYLGIVYITMHLPNQLKPEDSARIVEMFAQDKIVTIGGIGGHERSGYVRARERAFVGGIDAKLVKLARIIRVPNFSKNYRPFCKPKYGLSKEEYVKFKQDLENKRRDLMVTTQKIIEHIISHQSKALVEAAEHIAKGCDLQLMYVGETSGTFTNEIPDLKSFTRKKTVNNHENDPFGGHLK